MVNMINRTMVEGARKDVNKFSDEAFKELFIKDMKQALKK